MTLKPVIFFTVLTASSISSCVGNLSGRVFGILKALLPSAAVHVCGQVGTTNFMKKYF